MRTGLAIDYGLTWKFIGQADFALQATQINVYILPSSPGDSLRSSSWRLKGADMPCSPRGFFQEQLVPWGSVVPGSSWNALGIFPRSRSNPYYFKADVGSESLMICRVTNKTQLWPISVTATLKRHWALDFKL